MRTSKFLLSLLLGLAIIFFQVSAVYAAPVQDPLVITGTIQNVVIETNSATQISTVVVTWVVNGEVQNIRLSVETAAGLTLILVDDQGKPVLDANGLPVANTSWIGYDVDIDPSLILPEEPLPPVEPPVVDEPQHPVGSKIAAFFSSFFDDVNYELVMSSHSNGFGFGAITQALWMTEKLGGDATLFQTILDAKKSHDYSLVTLPDGSVPQNWGQLKKALLQGEDDNSLGDIVSNGNGHETAPGQGKDKDNANNLKDKPTTPPGQAKDKDDNSVIPPGQSKDKNKENNGNTKTPPGQDKDKTKDNNGNGKLK